MAEEETVREKALKEIFERVDLITADDWADLSKMVREKALKEISERVDLISPDDWTELTESACIFGGRPNPSFIKYRETVQRFIEENNISPVAQLSSQDPIVPIVAQQSSMDPIVPKLSFGDVVSSVQQLSPVELRYIQNLADRIIKNVTYLPGSMSPGIPAPDLRHIHKDNNIYNLDIKQAKELSNILANEFNVNLDNAGVVKF